MLQIVIVRNNYEKKLVQKISTNQLIIYVL